MTLALLLQYLPYLISGASVVAAVLPAPKPGSFGASILALINLAALNVGHAANATPAGLKSEKNNTSNVNGLLTLLLPAMLVAMFLAVPGIALADSCGIPASGAAPCPTGNLCTSWTVVTTRTGDNGEVIPLSPAELKGYEVSLADALIGSTTDTSYKWPIPTNAKYPAGAVVSVVAVDIKGLKSKPSGCSLPAFDGPKSPPASPAGVKAVAG